MVKAMVTSMKKILSILLALCLLCCGIPAAVSAEELPTVPYTDKNGNTFQFEPTTGTVTEAVKIDGELVIPVEIEVEGRNIPVKRIGENAFSNQTWLTGVKLPEGLELIDNGAFNSCSNLTELKIPGTVTEIGSGALANNQLDFRVPAAVNTIGRGAFTGCGRVDVDSENENYESEDGALYSKGKTVLYHFPSNSGQTSFTVPVTVEEIGVQAMSGNRSLKSVILPQGLKTIGGSAFWYCSGLDGLSIPAGVTSIGFNCLTGATGDITVAPENPNYTSVDGILYTKDRKTMLHCPVGKKILRLPKETVTMDNYALNECVFETIEVEAGNTAFCSEDNVLYDAAKKTLYRCGIKKTSIEIPDTLEEIWMAAFSCCDQLKTVHLPDGVKSIGFMAFIKCSRLETLTIPKSATDIKDGAFVNANPACNIAIDKDNPNYLAKDGMVFSKDGTQLFHAKKDVREVTIPEGVTTIRPYAFSGEGSSLQTVEMPDSVTEIQRDAFSQNDTLKTVVFSKQLKTIGDRAFSRDKALENVELPATVRTIGQGAFQECTSLKSIALPAGVEIQQDAFAFCDSLRKITGQGTESTEIRALFDANAMVLGQSAFGNCRSLKAVEVPEGTEIIDELALANCPVLQTVYIPGTVTEINSHAFDGSADFTIYGETGSAAELYANANQIPFVEGAAPELPDEPVTPPPTPGGNPGPEPSPGPSDSPVTEEEIRAAVEKFPDLSSHWGKEAAAWAYREGLFMGTTESSFAPDTSMSRGMIAAVLYRLAKTPDVTGGSLDFADVDAGQYFADAVIWAAENKIIAGISEDRYAPTDNVSREQLAAMLYRYVLLNGKPEASGDLSQFKDAGEVSGWALEAVKWAVGEGILSGKGNGVLDPKGSATRAEVASMLMRFEMMQ